MEDKASETAPTPENEDVKHHKGLKQAKKQKSVLILLHLRAVLSMCSVNIPVSGVLEQTLKKFYCYSLRNHCPPNTTKSIDPHPFCLIFTESTQL